MELSVIGEANVSVSLTSCVFVKLVTLFLIGFTWVKCVARDGSLAGVSCNARNY